MSELEVVAAGAGEAAGVLAAGAALLESDDLLVESVEVLLASLADFGLALP